MTSRRYCRCGTQLAGDNTGRLCGVCQATRQRGVAPDVPPEFWQTDVMAAALASGDLGRVIRAYRCHPFHTQRLSQTLVAGWLHMSQAAVCRLENGRRRLTIDEIVRIAQALGMPVAIPWAPRHEAGEDVDPISRRSLFGAGVGAALGLSATTAPTAAREIDPELVSHWLALLRLLGRHDAMCGSHDVLDNVCHEIDLIAGHRTVARGGLHTQLLCVEARWSDFASWLSNDTGDLVHRDYWSERALRLAREADHPDLVAWVLMRRSRWAVERRDPQRAIAFAEAAHDVTASSDHIRALCALRLAQSHALAHDMNACKRSLAAGHDLLGASTDDAPDLCRAEVTSAWVMGDEARCWLWLQPRKAIPMFGEVLRLLPHDRTRKRGVHQAHLAMACAGADEPERAAAEGMKALNIAQAIQSDVIVRRLRRLDHRLAASDAPAVADFRQAFAAL